MELDEAALYAPLTRGGWILGHLGQSLDGKIATLGGASHYVTGEANLDHLHRLRALADAVLVGPGTVASDDPRLTVRRVPGANPLRVVLDPERGLRGPFRVFQDDAAPTLLFSCLQGEGPRGVEVVVVPSGEGGLSLPAVVEELHRRGVARLLVEGGGVTVSRFLAAGLLDRLQICVAPLFIGEGRPGIRLPALEDLSHALRPPCRVFRMGEDVLFDCDLRAGTGAAGT